MSEPLFGGIDAGGTEFKCILGTGPNHILTEARFAVTRPEETLHSCLQFFQSALSLGRQITRLGIGSFGPVDLNRNSPRYGFITSTPKPYWQNVEVAGYFQRHLQLPVAFDTDVNAALLGEARWGAARGLHSAVYVTIGTGIGAGVMIDGHLVHGRMHPEAGHMLLPRAQGDDFAGICPFHGMCLEGLASGPALARRAGQDPATLADDHPVWQYQAFYLAAMCVNLALQYSPQRIILGGGVMQRKHLLDRLRLHYTDLINGYLGDDAVNALIVGAELGTRAGALGALALATGDR